MQLCAVKYTAGLLATNGCILHATAPTCAQHALQHAQHRLLPAWTKAKEQQIRGSPVECTIRERGSLSVDAAAAPLSYSQSCVTFDTIRETKQPCEVYLGGQSITKTGNGLATIAFLPAELAHQIAALH